MNHTSVLQEHRVLGFNRANGTAHPLQHWLYGNSESELARVCGIHVDAHIKRLSRLYQLALTCMASVQSSPTLPLQCR